MAIVSGVSTMSAVASVYGQREPSLATELEPLVQLDALNRELTSAIRSQELTPTGIAARREQLATKADAIVTAFASATEKQVQALAQAEAEAIRSRAEVSDVDRGIVASWIVQLPRERQMLEYLGAIEADDHRTIATFGSLPTSVSPLTDAMRQQGRERKLSKIDAATAGRLEAMRGKIGARQHASIAAGRVLRELRGT